MTALSKRDYPPRSHKAGLSMTQLMTFLSGKKTYIVAGVSIAWALFQYFYAHSIDEKAFEQLIQTAFLGAGIRMGITTQGNK